MIRHLTTEQLYAQLDTPQPDAHLASCKVCQAELAGLDSAFANLRLATTALAANAPALLHPVALAPRRRLLGHGLAATFATALVALGVAIPLHHRAPTPAPAANVAEPSLSDDALLEGISQDLSTSSAPSLKPLSIDASTAKSR